VAGFFISSNSVIGLTSSEIETREQLIGEYQAKYAKYAGAVKYKDQLVEIEKRFNEQLQQLPKETEIPGLLDDLNRAGKQAGLTIESLQLGTEVNKEFFIEQPIEIEASGDYHSFGKFVEMVSALPRIVTIQTFTAGERNEGVENRVPETKYVIKASTYRYLNKQADPAVARQ
jgi:type IV pilus assembly protein PilO